MGKDEKTKVVKRWDKRMCKRHWTLDEENKLLDYLIENNPIEVPTPKVYYSKLIKERKLDRNYVLIKNKLVSMKKAYYRLLDWKRIAIEKGAKVESDYRLIDGKEYVERKCPNFKKLQIICSPDFPVKELQQAPSKTHNVEEINFLTDPEDTFEGFKDIKDEIEEPEDELSIPDPLQDLQSLIDPQEETEETEERNEDEMSLRRMELEIEKERLAIEREKIAMQREQNQEEAKFKVLQLQQEGVLKRLQVETDAELKKYELSLKYKAKPDSEM